MSYVFFIAAGAYCNVVAELISLFGGYYHHLADK